MARRKPGAAPVRVTKESVAREIGQRQELYRDEPAPEMDPLLAPRQPLRAARTEIVESLRVPPHSVEAEQAVLGAVMLAPESWWQVSVMLKDTDFYRRDHQLIWRTLQTMMAPATGDPSIDPVTVGEQMESLGYTEQVHPAYLVELASTTPSAANCEAYAKIVADKAVLRRLIEAGTHLVNDGFHPDGKDSDEIMSRAIARIEETNPRVEADGIPSRQVMKSVFETIQARADWDPEQLPGLRFGFPMLEECIGGLEPERTYGFGGRTKMGKTIILENVATNVALDGHGVAIFSLEMSAQQWGNRMLAHVSGIEFEKLRRPGLLQDEDWEKMTHAMALLAKAPIKIFDQPSTVEQITARCVMMKKRMDLKMVAVDYLQLIKAPGMERRDLDIGHNSWGLKELSKRVGVPVIFGFQINRGNEQGSAVRPPRPSDARESGNIEQDLDAMILLHRPGYYDKTSKGCRAEVALQRDGNTGVFELAEQLDKSRFLPTDRMWADSSPGRNQREKGSETGFD